MSKEASTLPFGIFVCKDGEPCRFAFDGLDDNTFNKAKNLVKESGGIVEKYSKIKNIDSYENCILLTHPKPLTTPKYVVDAFSYQYLEDCIEAEEILPNLNEYLVGESKFEKYDPLEVMLGFKKWNDLIVRCEVLLEKMHTSDPKEPEIEAIDQEAENQVDKAAENQVDKEAAQIDSQETYIEQESPPDEIGPSDNQNPPRVEKRKRGKEISLKNQAFVEEEMSDIDEDNVVEKPNYKSHKEVQEAKTASSTSSNSAVIRIRPTKEILAAVAERKKQKETNKKVSAWLSGNLKHRQNSSPTGSTVSFLNNTKNGRAPYTRKEQESIIKDILKQKAYNHLKGVHYWKTLEDEKRACDGNRTWQSMKEHFRKKVKECFLVHFV